MPVATDNRKTLNKAKSLVLSVIEEFEETDFTQGVDEDWHLILKQRKTLCVAYLNLCLHEIEDLGRLKGD